MKILKLTAENIKKLTVVEISPEGNLIQITGKNGQGKTSVLDSIWWALQSAGIQSKPIRKDAEKARIELVLGDGKGVALTVERTFTEKNSYLSVKTADGAKYPSPQKLIDDLLGALTFDPLGFMRETAKGQFEILKGLVPLEVDLEELAKADKQDYEQRTSVNRDAKAARAKAVAVTLPDGLPEERVDERALLDKIEQAAKANEAREREIAQRQDTATKIKSLGEKAQVLRGEIAKYTAMAEEIESGIVTYETALSALAPVPEPIDVSNLRADFDKAAEINRWITARDTMNAFEQESAKLETISKNITKRMEDRAKARTDAIAAAKMPVEGISFGDGVVIFNGLPLEQSSDAEQLMVSTSIAAALNPKLRVLRIRDGSLLDDDAMKRLAAFADERDFQIWIERVDGSGAVGIVMEDGHVRGAAPAAKEEKKAEGGALL